MESSLIRKMKEMNHGIIYTFWDLSPASLVFVKAKQEAIAPMLNKNLEISQR